MFRNAPQQAPAAIAGMGLEVLGQVQTLGRQGSSSDGIVIRAVALSEVLECPLRLGRQQPSY
jgi:hypothetical protein